MYTLLYIIYIKEDTKLMVPVLRFLGTIEINLQSSTLKLEKKKSHFMLNKTRYHNEILPNCCTKISRFFGFSKIFSIKNLTSTSNYYKYLMGCK